MEYETLLTRVKSGEIAIPESSARLSGKGVRSVSDFDLRSENKFLPGLPGEIEMAKQSNGMSQA